MRNILFLVFLHGVFLIEFSAHAENRSSQLSASAMNGENNYQSYNLTSQIGFSEKWQATGSYFYSDSGQATNTTEQLISQELRLGADFQFHPSWGSFAEVISREDPYALYGRGAAAGISNNLSDFWKGKLLTRLSLNVERIRYSQNVTLVGNRASLNIQRGVNQSKRSIGLDQELSQWTMLRLVYSNYSYDESTSQLGLATSRRRTNFSGQRGPSYGLPNKSTSLTFVFNPWEWGETTISGNKTTFLTDTESKSNSWTVEQIFFYKKWELGIAFTKTKFLDDSSGTDDANQNYTQISLGYHW
ncbi:MAG: hypothetical protein QE271_03825 [Bacteriovoracaceae bacterium]|nr:hypothetical protein [Bacteriovoracaceae bacterium]